MASIKYIKIDIFKFLLIFFSLTMFLLGWYATYQQSVLKLDVEGLAQIENLYAGIQRVAKLELEHTPDLEFYDEMNTIGDRLFPEDGLHSIYFSNNEDMQNLIQDIADEGLAFEDSVKQYYLTENREILFSASELNYNHSVFVTNKIIGYIDESTAFLLTLKIILSINVVIIALVLIKILLNAHFELRKNKELSKDMFIDTSTGLYNRSKCQEILKSKSQDSTKHISIIIFDLNDLKKTNDGLGHRAGDDLISSFAKQLKDATNIFSYEVFVGRYGGDEFMVYFDDTEEKDVELYIKEVDYLMNKFNEDISKQFKLSCASGYCITTDETSHLSMREIFDTADETMYKNKLAMKEKKRIELEEQGVKLEEVVDDRLL